jgi:hypothetical protein
MSCEVLIYQIEAAMSGTAELNAAVGRLLGTWSHDTPSTWDGDGYGRAHSIQAPEYTTSLAAARSLCQGQWSIQYGHVGQGQYQAHARVTTGSNLSQWFDAWAATPELALTAANLKAMSAIPVTSNE